MALEDAEDQPRLAVELIGKPPAHELDPLRCNRLHLVVELRDVLGPVVVGILDNPEALHHRRAVDRGSGLVVEGDDAPGDEIVPSEELFSGHKLIGPCHGRRAHGQSDEHGEETKRSMNADHGKPPK